MLIHERMVSIMAEMPHIGKNQKNQQQGFKFRGIDDVMNTLNPLLVKYKVFLLPKVETVQMEDTTTKTGTVMHRAIAKADYTFVTDDGSSVTATSFGEGMDSGDKATSKAIAIAMKYAMFQTFCIATEEMAKADPDRECPQDEDGIHICSKCGKAIANTILKDGKILTAADIVEKSQKKFGKPLCINCGKSEGEQK